MNKTIISIITLIIVFLSGLGLGWKLYHPNDKPTGVDQPTVYVRDTSIVFKVVHDTVLKEKLVTLPGTTVVVEGEMVIKPGVDVVVRDTLIKIDTVSVDKGTKVNVSRRSNGDTLGHAFVKWPDIRINVLEDKKTNNYRIQAKVLNGTGTIVDEISVPKRSPIKETTNNQISVYGSFAPKDGVTNVGLIYDRGIGPFIVGPNIQTKINKWDDVSVGLNFGVRF